MSNTELLLELVGLVVLMGCSAFFSGSETAFSALGKTQAQRIRGDGRTSSKYIAAFLDNPRRFFITVLFGNTLVNIAFVTVTGSLIYQELFGHSDPVLASAVAVAVELVALLLLGEITPKTYALRHAESVSRLAAAPLWAISWLIYPFRELLRLLTDAVLRWLGIHGAEERHRVTGAELRAFVREAEESGVIEAHEAEVIGNIFELFDIDAKEIMTPRTDVVCVEVSATIGEAFARARETGYSRLPVYRGGPESICGIFLIKDLPRWKGRPEGAAAIEEMTIEEFLLARVQLSRRHPGSEDTLIRQPLFSYEAKNIGSLLEEMTRQRQRMAILLDEYGGVSGLVTIQDIVAEIIGEVFDRHARYPQQVMVPSPNEPGAFLVPALTSLRSVNRKCGLKLPAEQSETVGGYVIALLGAIPKEGDRIADEAHGAAFEVVAMSGPRVDMVRLRLLPQGPAFGGSPTSLLALSLPVLSVALVGASGGLAVAASSLTALLFLVVFAVSLLFIAFFAGFETAVVSASRELIEHGAESGDRRAAVIRALLAEPERLLATVLVGTNLATTMAGQAGVILSTLALPGQEGLQRLVNTALVTTLVLVFCEILPKTICHARANSLALRCAGPLRQSSRLLYPIVAVVTAVTKRVTVRHEEEGAAAETRITRDELQLLASMGGAEDQLRSDQLQMIRNVLGAETRTIDRIMVPLVNLAALPHDATTAQLFDLVTETGYSRIPVYEDRIDNIVGYVTIREVLFGAADASDAGTAAGAPGADRIVPFVRRDVGYEPGTRQVLSLLHQLRTSGHPLAIVVDEYGGVIGLVTTEDLVEEILGDIRDERDEDIHAYIRRISAGVYDCDGRAEVLAVNRLCGAEIPTGNYETIAGYVLSLSQRIPRQGELVETDRLRITVLASDARRIRRVRMQLKP